MASNVTGPLVPTGPAASLTSPMAGLPWQGQPPVEEGEGGIPWERFIAAIKRYKWLVLAVAMIGTVLRARPLEEKIAVTRNDAR